MNYAAGSKLLGKNRQRFVQRSAQHASWPSLALKAICRLIDCLSLLQSPRCCSTRLASLPFPPCGDRNSYPSPDSFLTLVSLSYFFYFPVVYGGRFCDFCRESFISFKREPKFSIVGVCHH